MTRIRAMLWAKLRISRNHIASVRNESKLKVAVVSTSAVLLWIGAYYAFWMAFIWLKRFGMEPGSVSLGDVIMSRLLSVFALALFLMLIFSNVLIAFSTLYKSREVAFLLQAPLPWWEFFIARFLECVSFSSWASAYLGSPLILAYGIANGAPWPYYLAAAAFYVPFVCIPAAIGAIVAMGLVRIFPRLPRGSMIGIALIAVVMMFLYLRNTLSAGRLSDPRFGGIIEAMSRTQSWLLPSHWASRGVLAAAQGQQSETAFYFLVLLANALMMILISALLAHWIYYTGWSDLIGNDMNRKSPPGRTWLSRIDIVFASLRNPHRALIIKDFRLFWRDPAQWSQFVIFFGIMAVYVASLRDRSAAFESATYRNWIVCLNIGACTLILATLTSRFVYPLISLEGRRFWVLGLAPLTYRQLIWQKFWLSVSTTSVFTITLVVLSCYKLGVEPIYFALAVYSIVITNFGLSGLAVGLGSLYPNFQEDNPARIVSGMGGTLNFLLSMAYITLVVGTQTFVMQWRALESFASPEAFTYALTGAVVFITVLSAVSTWLPMRLGLRNLNRAEY
jgi:ABC-2 type transport system permease protein